MLKQFSGNKINRLESLSTEIASLIKFIWGGGKNIWGVWASGNSISGEIVNRFWYSSCNLTKHKYQQECIYELQRTVLRTQWAIGKLPVQYSHMFGSFQAPKPTLSTKSTKFEFSMSTNTCFIYYPAFRTSCIRAWNKVA